MIKTQNLTKSYDGLLAVDDLTFSVEPGEVLGFLGPNGAGKSTTMRMLAGFITPTSGTGSICGHDISADPLAAKAALGYLPEGAPHYGEMTVGGLSTTPSICPAIRSCTAGAAPRYGTWVIGASVRCFMSSVARCISVPVPGEP